MSKDLDAVEISGVSNNQDLIDISDLDKGTVLKFLWNGAKDVPSEQSEPLDDISIGMCQRFYNASQTKCFNLLNGRSIKCDLHTDMLNPYFYDEVNGAGSAKKAIDDLREQIKSNNISATKVEFSDLEYHARKKPVLPTAYSTYSVADLGEFDARTNRLLYDEYRPMRNVRKSKVLDHSDTFSCSRVVSAVRRDMLHITPNEFVSDLPNLSVDCDEFSKTFYSQAVGSILSQVERHHGVAFEQRSDAGNSEPGKFSIAVSADHSDSDNFGESFYVVDNLDTDSFMSLYSDLQACCCVSPTYFREDGVRCCFAGVSPDLGMIRRSCFPKWGVSDPEGVRVTQAALCAYHDLISNSLYRNLNLDAQYNLFRGQAQHELDNNFFVDLSEKMDDYDYMCLLRDSIDGKCQTSLRDDNNRIIPKTRVVKPSFGIKLRSDTYFDILPVVSISADARPEDVSKFFDTVNNRATYESILKSKSMIDDIDKTDKSLESDNDTSVRNKSMSAYDKLKSKLANTSIDEPSTYDFNDDYGSNK